MSETARKRILYAVIVCEPDDDSTSPKADLVEVREMFVDLPAGAKFGDAFDVVARKEGYITEDEAADYADESNREYPDYEPD